MKNKLADILPISNTVITRDTPLDSSLLDAMVELGVIGIFRSLKISKRSGETSIEQIVYALLLMSFLSVSNVWCFAGKFLDIYISGGKDVLYCFLSRQDINWSLIHLHLARKLWSKHYVESDELRAFVLDDTLKKRRGKKVQAMSSHFDHNEGRHVMGQQVLQFGISDTRGFLPLLCQIFVGKKKATKRGKEFNDKRSAIARSYQTAYDLNKHEMLASFLTRALSFGFYTPFLIADSWFGTKSNLSLAISCDLTAIFMMKRNKTKYRYQGKDFTLKGLYRNIKKNQFASGKRFMYATLIVDFNLAGPKEEPKWQTVKLVFSKAKKAPKGSWVVILCTEPSIEAEKILEIYALRWSIECYFKEIKQNFGFLKEETGAYETHYASIHLAAMRYVLLYHISLSQLELKFAAIRKKLNFQMELFSFAVLAWDEIKHVVNGVLDELLEGPLAQTIMKAIDERVTEYLHRALQIDTKSIEELQYAEKQGLLP